MESASFRLHECPELGERYYETRHPSGLRILVCPKDMTTAYAALGVPCGSFDRARGEPAGVAHFLEHKMFETARGGDAETAFAALGAEVNAYTTYDRTVYLFSCTEGRAGSFDRALGALLCMVSGLHITPDSVRRERRIIREEIRMEADDPWEVCANLLLRSLYRSHPIRGDICGTEASVGRITAEILHTAFSARYDRGGMTLAVCGQVTPEQVLAAVDACPALARKPGGQGGTLPAPRPVREPAAVCRERAVRDMRQVTDGTHPDAGASVSKPVFSLGIKDADVHPKVSEHMGEIIAIIQKLVEGGFAYNKDGNVYYRVGAFKTYGRLSKQSIEDLMSGARVEVNDEKENPLDFALWKKRKEGEPYWDSPWGEGRPGWHIECSAMSQKYLGDTIDIHGGGQDLVFPHHENEIAQSEAASGHPFVRYWVHNGYINVDNVKMSKSLGNFFTIRDISKKFDLEVVRMFILSAHYKSPINFSDESLMHAQGGLERLYNVKKDLQFRMEHTKNEALTAEEKAWTAHLADYAAAFDEAMEDDINTANALSSLFELAKDINVFVTDQTSLAALKEAQRIFMNLADVLGLLTKKDELLDEDIQKLIDERQEARARKDFKRSDEIRDLLKERGITLEDTREGVKWKRN